VKRKAVVHSDKSEQIAEYLPPRYHVTEVKDGKTYIEGKDFLGWTLDGYIIPRLASGWFACEEIPFAREFTITVLDDEGAEMQIVVQATDLIDAVEQAMQEVRERGLRPAIGWEAES